MSDWTPWIQTHPFRAAGLGLLAGTAGLCALGLLVAPVLVIASANPVLGVILVSFMAAAGYAGLQYRSESNETTTDPVTALERRYVDGDLSEEEFEYRLDKLIETDAALGRLTDSESTTARPTDAESETRQLESNEST
jgi:uncharacterized membrane protein